MRITFGNHLQPQENLSKPKLDHVMVSLKHFADAIVRRSEGILHLPSPFTIHSLIRARCSTLVLVFMRCTQSDSSSIFLVSFISSKLDALVTFFPLQSLSCCRNYRCKLRNPRFGHIQGLAVFGKNEISN